jgi:oxygen-independent coproporphyrinogen-3 oxidase
MEVDPREYQTLFGADLDRDFPVPFRTMKGLGMIRRENEIWRVTGFGSVWMHRFQQLFSITYIDELWAQCQAEEWPREVALA